MNDYDKIIGLNYSGAKELLRSPAHYKAYLEADRKVTPDMRIGLLTHTALFEPAKYNATVKVGPEVKTKAAKEWKEFVASLPEGVEPLEPEEYNLIDDITTAAEQGLGMIGLDPQAWDTEMPLSKVVDGVTIKGRTDLISKFPNGDKVVVDLKTTVDASPHAFARTIHDLKYHMQAAFYMELTGATRYVLLAVEKKAPFGWRIYELDAESIEEGRRLMKDAIALYSTCLALNAWPGYETKLTSISLPKYAFTQPTQ